MGKDKKNEKRKGPTFAALRFDVMDDPSWLSLTACAKALYPVFKRRSFQAGTTPEAGNGHFTLSVREAAAYLNVGKNRAQEVFHELQAHGFIVPVEIGCFGVEGAGKATRWRLTEEKWNGRLPTYDFRQWRPGHDLHVAKGFAPRKKQNPVTPGKFPDPSQRDLR